MRRARVMVVTTLALSVFGCNRSKQESHTDASSAPSAHAEVHWTYTGETGPDRWGALQAEWSPCGGAGQSPVDIDHTAKSEATDHPVLQILHRPHVADEVNNGHTIQVNYTQGDTLRLGSDVYALKQYHFHAPSEHTVRGKRYPMEMHLVHQADDGRLAVIGVFIEQGAHNKAFDPIWSNLPRTAGGESHLDNVTVDVDQLLPRKSAVYRYDGSLTTPPCSEGVKWMVMATPIQLSAEQIGAFRGVIDGNSRPVQALNGRVVTVDEVQNAVANH